MGLYFFSLFIILLSIIYYFNIGKRKPTTFQFTDFKPEWRKLLHNHIIYYRSLEPEEKIEFERRITRFLKKVRITGIKTTVEEIDCLLVASSAIIPTFAIPRFEYTTIREVLLYPDLFNTDFEITGPDRRIGGMVGTGSLDGMMILSKPLLRKGFSNSQDKKNVGIHEFLHLMDKEDGLIDGIPKAFMDNAPSLPWMELGKKKIDQILSNQSDINPYGATNAEEFFAVAGEYFFERPVMMHQKHPELYSFLKKVFRQNLVEKLNHKLSRPKEIGRNDPCPCGSGEKFKRCCLQ